MIIQACCQRDTCFDEMQQFMMQVVTWGHPCCFERVRRKPGHPDENRVWFRPTVDLCREEWLILHKIECAPCSLLRHNALHSRQYALFRCWTC